MTHVNKLRAITFTKLRESGGGQNLKAHTNMRQNPLQTLSQAEIQALKTLADVSELSRVMQTPGPRTDDNAP